MDGNTRICKKCLLREMDEAGFFQNMYDYIARIPADDKTPEEEYERRLSICKECEKLLSGMCRMCGCYRKRAVHILAAPSPCRLDYGNHQQCSANKCIWWCDCDNAIGRCHHRGTCRPADLYGEYSG